MTEEEWLECTDPQKMLELFAGKTSERKLRLFACACCRRIESNLREKRSRWIIEVSERYADGRATRERLDSAWANADIAFQSIHLSGEGEVEQNAAQAVLGLGVNRDVNEVMEFAAATFGAVARGNAYERIWQTHGSNNDERVAKDDAIRVVAANAERNLQAVLLRDILGNPFRPVTIDPRWLTSTVVDLAIAIYQERAFDRMPILADALMDAGCDDEEIISHCRGEGPHVRGCWVVDLLTGRE